jgi:hypothetical protein
MAVFRPRSGPNFGSRAVAFHGFETPARGGESRAKAERKPSPKTRQKSALKMHLASWHFQQFFRGLMLASGALPK